MLIDVKWKDFVAMQDVLGKRMASMVNNHRICGTVFRLVASRRTFRIDIDDIVLVRPNSAGCEKMYPKHYMLSFTFNKKEASIFMTPKGYPEPSLTITQDGVGDHVISLN